MRVGWIGLGQMGSRMARKLIEKGNFDGKLLLHNRTLEKCNAYKDDAEICQTPEKLIQAADLIFTIVGDDHSVLTSYERFLRADVKGKIFADCSTVHPETTTKLEEMVHAAGAKFVASPVFGAPAVAASGMLVFCLAGDDAAVGKVVPFTEGVMGKKPIHLGRDVDKASKLKIIGNTFIQSMVETLSEGHVLAEKSGLGNEPLHQMVDTVFGGPFTAYSNRLLQGDYLRKDPLFAVDLARKDARHAKDLAAKAGTRMEICEIADRHLQQVKEQQGASGDIAGIYGAVRKNADLPYSNQ